MKLAEPSGKNLVIIGVSVFFLLVALVLALAGGDSKPENPAPTKPKADTSNLKLAIVPGVLGLNITNKESKDLVNCEIKIDPGYKTRATLPVNQEVTLSYTSFTKNSEIYDTNKYAVEHILVSNCRDESRLGIYGTR